MIYQGKTAVVTGAASGIGRGLVLEAAARGMNVLACDIDAAALAALSADDPDGRIATRVTDVADPAAVEAMADAAYDRFGAVHVLFNNAGVYIDGTSWLHPPRQWDWMLNIDVKGVAYGINAFAPRMLAAGEEAIIANTASIAGLMSFPYVGCYGAAKHAVVALTESLHYELAAAGAPVRAALICPGAVASGIADSARTNRLSVPGAAGDDPAASQFHDVFSGIIAQGMAPRDHARFVFDELARGRFWVISDRGFLGQIEERMRSIHEQRAPVFR